ncbi:MAG: hypothetical protein ABI193_19165 [Minicystis sp.]
MGAPSNDAETDPERADEPRASLIPPLEEILSVYLPIFENCSE